MADLGTLRTTLATALDTIPAIGSGKTAIPPLRVHAGGLWPDTVNPPAALIRPTSDDPMSLDETVLVQRFEIIVVVQGGAMYESSQRVLDFYCSNTGTWSVKAALQTALGGLLLSCNRREYGTFEVGGVVLAGAQFAVEVISE